MDDDDLATFFDRVNPHLDERQRRVLAGSVARVLGRGGIVAVAEANGMSRSTVQGAVAQIDEGIEVSARVRAEGGGRPRLVDKDLTLLSDLDSLVEPETRGDPMCPLRWTTKSTEHLAQALRDMGHVVSPDTVGRLLVAMGYSLQAPAKENEGTQHPDRDAQFRYLNGQVEAHLRASEPVISVDAKKKEVLGNLANKGREYQPKGEPARVDVHDFDTAWVWWRLARLGPRAGAGPCRLRLWQIGSEHGRRGVTGRGRRERLAARSGDTAHRVRSDGRRGCSPRSGGFRGSGSRRPGTHRPCRLVWRPSAARETTARRGGHASSLVYKHPNRSAAGLTGRTTWCTRRSPSSTYRNTIVTDGVWAPGAHAASARGCARW